MLIKMIKESKRQEQTFITLLNKEVGVTVKKSYTMQAIKSFEIIGDFFVVDNGVRKVSINKQNVLCTSVDIGEPLKLTYLVNAYITGTIVNIDRKFITVRVFDRVEAKFYDYVFSIGLIEGIKVLDYKEEKYIYKDKENEKDRS